MMKPKDKIFKWYDWIVIIVSLSLIICSPILLSQKWGLGNFGGPSQIGDTIGGITSPFVGLLGAYFVFIGFRAQLEANRLLKSQWREDKIRQEFDSMVARFEDILNNFQSGDKRGFVGLDYYTRNIAEMITAIQNKSASHHLFHQKLKEQVNSLEMRNLHHLLINFHYLVQFIDREKNNVQFPTFWLFQNFQNIIVKNCSRIFEINITGVFDVRMTEFEIARSLYNLLTSKVFSLYCEERDRVNVDNSLK